jgi:hypothetical protein
MEAPSVKVNSGACLVISTESFTYNITLSFVITGSRIRAFEGILHEVISASAFGASSLIHEAIIMQIQKLIKPRLNNFITYIFIKPISQDTLFNYLLVLLLTKNGICAEKITFDTVSSS